MSDVVIIGGGLAGAEASYQLARHGMRVTLYEMRPLKLTEAHRSGLFGELVCSNSLRAEAITNAHGLLKRELELGGSLIMEAAWANRVPAGVALAVERVGFARFITQRILAEKNITVKCEEVTNLETNALTILATGPLTSAAMSEALVASAGAGNLYFYDAIAPIIDGSTIDYGKAFFADRYGKGGGDYLNCPMSRDEYDRFYHALVEADKVSARQFEDERYFEGCMPIEVMAKRGYDTLCFGPLKPVGIESLTKPYAVLQLRAENINKTAFNMVGFQTRLKIQEQRRVFTLIPGLEHAEFLRYGSIHRNTFINAPAVLNKDLSLKSRPNIFLAGQVTGVEGYLESTAMGLIAAIFVFRRINNLPQILPSINTAHGSLINYLTESPSEGFQPCNINFGIIPPLDEKIKDKVKKKLKIAERAIKHWEGFIEMAYR